MFCLSVEWASHSFLEKVHDYIEYLILEEQNRVRGYYCSSVASERGQRNLMLGVDPNIAHLPGGVNKDDDWDLDAAIGGEFLQRVAVKRKL